MKPVLESSTVKERSDERERFSRGIKKHVHINTSPAQTHNQQDMSKHASNSQNHTLHAYFSPPNLAGNLRLASDQQQTYPEVMMHIQGPPQTKGRKQRHHQRRSGVDPNMSTVDALTGLKLKIFPQARKRALAMHGTLFVLSLLARITVFPS